LKQDICWMASLALEKGRECDTKPGSCSAFFVSHSRAVFLLATATGTWALECARTTVTVNGVLPTALTQMVVTIPGMEAYVEAAQRGEALPPKVRMAMGMGTATDVAPLFVFLASDAAQHITGQCIGLGGDKLALWSHPQEIRAAYSEGGWTADKSLDTLPTRR
jgi:NAD(P)-dependent dehydrogenase (short-subunit alcohol dehydrogenase family)